MLTVNLYGGPGSGKYTTAAGVFAELKHRGISAELVPEFAKECAWEGRAGPLACQPYVFGQQLWRIERLRGRGVEIVVTDSPVFLSAIYAPPGTPPEFLRAIGAYAFEHPTLDVFLERTKRYDPRGRFQDETEARRIDDLILGQMGDNFDLSVPGDPASVPIIVEAAIRAFRASHREPPC